LTEGTWEAERALWLQILDEARVNLTPGAACHNGEPGFMRLCYAGLPTETVEVGVHRLVKLLDAGVGILGAGGGARTIARSSFE
jgi:aspartate/methionine/tyrosine aminotransferase